MYLGSDAIALAPFTDTISYLEDGDWVGADAARARRCTTPHGKPVERAVHQVDRLGVAGRQGQPPPLHGEGNPRAAGGRRPHARALPRHGARARARCRANCRSICEEAQAHFDLGLRHRLSMPASSRKYWFERFARLPVEIDVASEFRYREAPLDAGRPRDLRLAVGRDRRHARDAALRQGAQAARALGRQRADLDHRARERRRDADAGRPGDRRRLDQGVHLPARGAGLPRDRAPAARAACCQREDEQQARARADRGAAPDGARRSRSSRRSSSWRAISRRAATCSISAAARASRSRSKAR